MNFKFDLKNMGIGAGIGVVVTGAAAATPRIAKWAKRKAQSVKLNKSLKKDDPKSQEDVKPTNDPPVEIIKK